MWLENLLPGGVFWGHPRMGKTQAIRYLIDNAPRLLGAPIPVTLLSTFEGSASSSTENRFYAAMLAALGYGSPNAGVTAVKRQRTIDFMIDRVQSAQEHRYLLFIDEAQWMSISQFRALMDLHNQMKIRDIRLVAVLVGQPELLDLKLNLKQANQNHLLGRFMTAVHRFEGVVGQSDFVRLCRGYDLHSEWPEDSGISFTQYFVPKAWAAGWRLEKHAVAVWTVIADFRRRDNPPATGELPMQALAALLRWLLKTLHDRDAADLALEEPTIEEAYERVAREQIRDHFGSLNSGKGK